MADVMMFPKTVDEFMEQYKVVDTEKVYTNGAELVPIFRMKQWFEHLGSAIIEAEPVKHGRWIIIDDDDSVYQCSVCKEISCCKSSYCGDCGAKMDLGCKDESD